MELLVKKIFTNFETDRRVLPCLQNSVILPCLFNHQVKKCDDHPSEMVVWYHFPN